MIHRFHCTPEKSVFPEIDELARRTWPHMIIRSVSTRIVDPAVAWCAERFGQTGLDRQFPSTGPYIDVVTLDADKLWINTGSYFCFVHPDHAFEFKMAWG